MWCTSHHDDGRPQRAQPPSRAATARRSPSGITRVARPTSKWLALAVEHDRHDRGVAAQHPQRLGAQRAAEVQTPGASPVLQILQAHEHVQVWAPSATEGHVGVVEHVPARVGERFGLPLRWRALVLGVDGTGLRVDHRGDRVEHRGVVEMPLQCATCSATEALQVHLVDRIRRAVVGLGSVLVQRVDQSAAPFQQLRGRVPVGVGRQLGFGTRPDRGRQPLRGRAGQHPRDHLDVPQTRCSRGELLRRRGQPRGQARLHPARCGGRPVPLMFTRRRASARSQPMRSATAVTALRYPRSANVPRRNKSATTATTI